MSRTMHDIRYDEIHDEFVVNNPFAQAVLVFRGAAQGEEPPIRIIQGPKTQLSDASRLTIDPVHDEIYVPGGAGRILVFPRTANGDVSPVRVITSPEMRNAGSLAVDPVHNLLIVGVGAAGERGPGGRPSAKLLIFNRTANGSTMPRAVIQGPRTGLTFIAQLEVYPAGGWIIVPQQGDDASLPEQEGIFVGIWNINDKGDVAPRWMLAGPKSQLKKPRGVALDPKHKELIVADMTLNAVLTYSFPEIF